MLGLLVGDTCKGSGSTAWKCEYLKNCPQIGDFRSNHPAICTFQGIDPIICCPPTPAQRNNEVRALVSNGNAAKMCSNQWINLCPKLPPSLILGGSPAPARQHKFMIA